MNITCDIIRDLLPLYAEDMVSGDSKRLVDEHLCGCDECIKELAILKRTERIPVEVDTKFLKKIRKTMDERRWLSVLLALFMIPAIIFGTLLFLTRPIYMACEEAAITVSDENGDVRVFLGDNVDCYCVVGTEYENEHMTLTYTAYRRIWNIQYGNPSDAALFKGVGHSVAYHTEYLDRICYDGEPAGNQDVVLWGEQLTDNVKIWPRSWMPNLWWVCLGVTAVLVAVYFACRKSFVLNISILPCSYAFWELLIAYGNWKRLPQVDLLMYVGFVVGLSLLTWGSCVVALKLHLLNKQDKGK